jgi:hypothetical protein
MLKMFVESTGKKMDIIVHGDKSIRKTTEFLKKVNS